MDGKNSNYQNDPGTYQTGRTQPPKRYGGIIAFLLALVILLSGISTALSILNLKLYWQLSAQEKTPQVAFSRMEDGTQPTEPQEHEQIQALQDHLGIGGTTIPTVYQRYYKLPSGIYVSQVSRDSEASQKGMVVGDIITKINTVSILDDSALDLSIQFLKPGDPVELTLYRSGAEVSLSLTWFGME